MKKIFCTLCPLALCVALLGQVTDIIPSSVSIANTSVARTDVWSPFGNPATLVQSGTFQASMQYENKTLLPELSNKVVQGAYMNKWVNVGVAFSHFGYSKYNEMLVGLVLTRNFADRFSIGIQGNFYTSYFSPIIKYQSTFIPQVGMTARVSPKLTLGFQTFNPFQQNLKTDYIQKRLPSLFSIGTNYCFTDQISWHTQVDKEVSSQFRIATGFEWCMVDEFSVKIGGYGSQYFIGCFGAGIHFPGFQFNVNCEIHPVLGVNLLGNLTYTM